MNTVDIITKKRDGISLTTEEIRFLVDGYTAGDIPDYQMAAFLMAVFFKGMDRGETVCLTECMRDSGDVVDLSGVKGIKVDKHSTGGVGDKTTLIVGPIASACGVPIAKMSGRGLGFTGGTVDKLESIPGFRTSMEESEFIDQVNTRGIAVIGQTGHIAPADKKIYALRDVTGTVENLSLITSSIMSKKLAAGSDAILLDVKCGRGAFMKTEEEAVQLAQLMVDIGNDSGKKTMAVISDMEQPLGRAVGNSLEVMEAIDVLKGQGPEDITQLSLELAGIMVYLSQVAGTEGLCMEDGIAKGREAAGQALADGRALQRFCSFVEGQGGDPKITEDPGLLPQATLSATVKAERDGFITSLDAMAIGIASQHTGAGRQRKEDAIDLSAGTVLNAKRGDKVCAGDVLCTLYGNDETKLKTASEEAAKAFAIDDNVPEERKLIKRIIG
ncbi:MAG: pyrimidine-nucleoside phosphorylase [Firmicutes bacterium]|nr:pyrimidine-nucleoside phosphorylase [Bacillota bacterium]